jgi:hypothetical protein
LRVTVLANERTGLAAPDVFSFGSLVGDAGDGDAAPFRANALDLAAVKRVLGTDSAVTGRFDFNRDGRVNALDLALVKQNLGRTLGAATPSASAAVPFTTTASGAAAATTRRIWDEPEPTLFA